MNNRSSRTITSLRNSCFAIIGQVINILLQFLLRTVFIRTLGIQYLGVNGLFTNILSVLSLTELGLGTTIIYSLYKPLAEKDTLKVKVLVKAFKKTYAVIAAIILIIGITLTPFLGILIKDSPDVGDLRFIFFLFLTDSVLSYFFAHYRSLLSADQKGYIETKNKIIFTLIQGSLQVVVLIFLNNFYLYLLVRIIINIFSGYMLSLKAKNMYSYLNEKTDDRMLQTDIINLIKNSLAMFSHKFGFVVLNSTDNIIISRYIGSVAVGLYSNYYLIISTISMLLSLVVAAMQSSVGNLCATADNNKTYQVFLKLNFAYAWVYGFCAICLYVLSTPFINIWIGKNYIIQNSVIAILIINFYIQGMRQSVLIFTTANGLFYSMRFKPIFEVLINILISLVLVRFMGMLGVFLGTLVSLLFTSFWYEPYTLYSKEFKKSLRDYFQRYISYTAVHVFSFLMTYYISKLIADEFILGFATKLVICLTVPNLIFYFMFIKTDESKYVVATVKNLMGRKSRMFNYL